MPHHDQFCPPPRHAHGRRQQPRLAAFASSENKFAFAHRHSVQGGCVIQAEYPAFHRAGGGEFGNDRCHMPASALHPAGCVQLRKEADYHAPSLPSVAAEGKKANSNDDNFVSRSSARETQLDQ